MNNAELDQAWLLAETKKIGSTEISAFSVGIRSEGCDLCVGYDQQARRHLLVPLPVDKKSAPPFKSAGLFIRTRPLMREGQERLFLDLVCLSPELNNIFSHLVLDVLQNMRPDESKASEICLNVLEEWKELFGFGSTGMGKEQIIGLVGELFVLEELTAINPMSLHSWDGPVGGIHDFRHGKRAIEVKTSTRRHGRFFTISGHQQLEPPIGGDLHLAALKLEQNPGGTISIPSLIEKIKRNGVNPILLSDRLSGLGYVCGVSDQVDSIRFDLSECLFYLIDNRFPRVVSSSFACNHLPHGIIKISYEIDLSSATPEPLSEPATKLLLSQFNLGESE